MKSGEETLTDNRQRRPALATGLPAHRAPARQAAPRRPGALWMRRGLQVTGLVLIAIVAGVLLYISRAPEAEIAEPPATAPPAVVENTPDSEVSANVPDEPAVAAPVTAPAPVDTQAPTAAATPAVVATAPAPTATRTPVPATATPVPEGTTTAATASSQVWVANTGGSGVYVRGTPSAADRLRAYGDGTQLTVIGEDVTGDGQQWKHVRTPDGLEGYVPAAYVIDTAP